mgnify:CR=1 FL=1
MPINISEHLPNHFRRITYSSEVIDPHSMLPLGSAISLDYNKPAGRRRYYVNKPKIFVGRALFLESETQCTCCSPRKGKKKTTFIMRQQILLTEFALDCISVWKC